MSSQIDALEDVNEVTDARFWELVPGHVVGSLSLKVNAKINVGIYLATF